MTIDESGKQCTAAQINYFCYRALVFCDFVIGANRQNLSVFDRHCVRFGFCVIDRYYAAASKDLVRNLAIRWCSPNDGERGPDSKSPHSSQFCESDTYLFQNWSCRLMLLEMAIPMPALL